MEHGVCGQDPQMEAAIIVMLIVRYLIIVVLALRIIVQGPVIMIANLAEQQYTPIL